MLRGDRVHREDIAFEGGGRREGPRHPGSRVAPGGAVEVKGISHCEADLFVSRSVEVRLICVSIDRGWKKKNCEMVLGKNAKDL